MSSTAASALFPSIYDIIEQNPKKNQALKTAVKQIDQKQQQEQWDIFTVMPIDTPGALSFYLWNTDAMYSQGTQNLRKQILSEKILEIQGRIDAELSGRRWSRKKIADLVAGQLAAVDPDSSALLEEALCYMLGFQKVVISRRSKKISFFPADIRLWRSDKPTFYGDDENRWYYEATKPISLSTWVTTKEDEKWTIQWPHNDGKLEDMRAALMQRGLTAHLAPGANPSSKIKKEDWARCLGRTEAIEALLRLSRAGDN